MNKALAKHIVVPILYASVLVLLFFVTNYFVINQIVFFMIGSVLATVLLVGDQLIFSKYYNENKNDPYLVTRSTLFLLAFIPLSFFVVTSSGSIIGLGLILTLATSLLVEMWTFRHATQTFQELYLSQLSKQYTQRDIDFIVIFAGLFVLVLHLFVIR